MGSVKGGGTPSGRLVLGDLRAYHYCRWRGCNVMPTSKAQPQTRMGPKTRKAAARTPSKRRNADKSLEREAELLLAKINAGLDEAHARADRLLALMK
jgi:hypothetical protein